MSSTFERIREIERREIDRLETYLKGLDTEGWLEQSYDTEWRVYQVVSHVASQSVIYLGFLASWFEGGSPMTQEQMKEVWDKFNGLRAVELLPEFRLAKAEYVAKLDALPSEAGLQEVDGPLGKVTADTMLALRLHEVVLHSWDLYVARDRKATLPLDAVDLVLPVQLQMRTRRKPLALAGKLVQLRTPNGQWQHIIDFRGEKPVVTEGSSGEAGITVEAPREELCRLLGGRHHLPGSRPQLTRHGGSYQELTALSVFAG